MQWISPLEDKAHLSRNFYLLQYFLYNITEIIPFYGENNPIMFVRNKFQILTINRYINTSLHGIDTSCTIPCVL